MYLLKEKAYCILIGLFLFTVYTIQGQDQRVADSLAHIYHSGNSEGLEKMELLRNLAFNELNNPGLAIQYANELIDLAQAEGNHLYLYRGHLLKGHKARQAGTLEEALSSYYKSADAAQKAAFREGEGSAYMSVADVYSVMGNSTNAETYYLKSISILRETPDSVALASALSNAGDEYFLAEKYDRALAFLEEAAIIFNRINYHVGQAYALGNIGMVFAQQGKKDDALININEAIGILEEQQDYYPISVYLAYISDIYKEKGDFTTALDYAQRSFDLAVAYGLKEQISAASLALSKLYEAMGNIAASFQHFRTHVVYRDSVRNITSVQEMADLRTEFEVSQKQVEVDLLNQQKRTQKIIAISTAVALFLIGLMAIGLYRRNKFIQRTKMVIEEEKNRSEALLLNILPEETALELREKGKVSAKKFDSVTVMFSDFVGFTSYAESLTPEELVMSVDHYFSRFDLLMEKYGLEKIKTIGDSYMCAAGLRPNQPDHAIAIVRAALEFLQVMEEARTLQYVSFGLRIGINTGPVIAGVVGTKKFSYDIWGDAVNVASRMETMSETGRINISQHTYELVKGAIPCEFRGKIPVKNRGEMAMYFVENRVALPLAEGAGVSG